jgi:prepilin-type N-terminal cleavage/methylation domain-containing protein
MNKGFTLFEMIVVVFIIGFLSSVLVLNFKNLSDSPMARHQLSSLVVSDIRRAQSLALAGVKYNDLPVCGFGLHYVSSSLSYYIYVRPPDTVSGACDIGADRDYDNLTDSIMETRVINNSSLTVSWTDDVFFELPNSRAYIANSINPSSLGIVDVALANGDGICPGADCTRITISTSGRIDINN